MPRRVHGHDGHTLRLKAARRSRQCNNVHPMGGAATKCASLKQRKRTRSSPLGCLRVSLAAPHSLLPVQQRNSLGSHAQQDAAGSSCLLPMPVLLLLCQLPRHCGGSRGPTSAAAAMTSQAQWAAHQPANRPRRRSCPSAPNPPSAVASRAFGLLLLLAAEPAPQRLEGVEGAAVDQPPDQARSVIHLGRIRAHGLGQPVCVHRPADGR